MGNPYRANRWHSQVYKSLRQQIWAHFCSFMQRLCDTVCFGIHADSTVFCLAGCYHTYMPCARTQVIGGLGVGIEPPLKEHEIAAICRHFDANLSSKGGRSQCSAGNNVAGRAEDGGLRLSRDSDTTVSYRAFMAWVDPVDVVRVSKRCGGQWSTWACSKCGYSPS